MESKRESALVGIFVLVASGLLLATTFHHTSAQRTGGRPSMMNIMRQPRRAAR